MPTFQAVPPSPRAPTTPTAPTTPILPALPRAQQAYRSRLAEWLPTLQQIPGPTARSFIDYNAQKVSRGQYPLTTPEAQLALAAAMSGEAQSAPAEDFSIGGNLNPLEFLGNVKEDIETITTTFPRMLIPNRGNPLYEEAQGLLNLPENISTALAEGDSLGEDISNVAALPGVRMIPGSYVVENAAVGDFGELLRHPVMTGLDILPYASKAAKALPVNRAATQAFESDLLARASTPLERGLLADTVNPATLPTLRAPGPFRTALTRTIDPVTGQVVPNRLGAVTQSISRSLGRMGGETARVYDLLGKFGVGEQGKVNRAGARSIAASTADVNLILSRNRDAIARIRNPRVQQAATLWADLHDKYPIHMADEGEALASKFQRDPLSLTPDERAFADDYIRTTRAMEQHLSDRGDLMRIGAAHDAQLKTDYARSVMNDEVIPREQWSAVRKADAALDKAQQNLFQYEMSLKATRDTLTGADYTALAPAYEKLGLTLPVPPTPATQLFIRELDNLTDLDPLSSDLVRQYKTEINRLATTDNPRVGYESAVRARRALGRMRQRKAFQSSAEIAMAQRELTEATRWMTDAKKRGTLRSSRRAIARAEAKMDRVMARTLPARWRPTAFDEFDKMVRAELDRPGNGLTPDEIAMGHRLVDEGVYSNLSSIFGDNSALIKDWEASAERTWMEAKRSGVEPPIFMHQVPAEEAARLHYPRVGEQLIKESQAKARTWDARPYIHSPSVAIDHQMKEILERAASEEIVEAIGATYGKTQNQLLTQLTDELGSTRAAMDEIERTTVKWPPDNFGSSRKVSNSPTAGNQIRVPRQLHETMAKLNERTKLDAIFDPAMRMFRTAVLPLAPRWHFYNVLGGGAIMTLADPQAWGHFADAYRTMREAEGGGGFLKVMKDAWNQEQRSVPSTVPRGAPSTGEGGSGLMVSEQLLRPPKGPAARMVAGRSWLGGNQLGDLWNQVQDWKRSQPGGKTWFGRAVDASYAANAYVDNLYRTSVAIEQFDKAAKAGKSTRAAELEAIRGVRSVMQNWDELLPLERQILRTLFPFYSWARFSLGFVMRYPMDHPVRASFLSSLARIEAEDQGTGLPDQFLGLFQLSSVDADGNASFLRTAGINPFRDTVDWFSIAGFVGQTNPVISATLQSLGVDTRSGTPTLYPTLKFDPETGGLVADTPSFPSALVSSMIPQSRLISTMIGANSQWNELAKRNPQAALQQIQGQMGLPVVVEQRNMDQEAFRAEMNRYEAFQDARIEALREGTAGDLLDRYNAELPVNANGLTLEAYLGQLAQLDQAGLLGPYRDPRQQPSWQGFLSALGGTRPTVPAVPAEQQVTALPS